MTVDPLQIRKRLGRDEWTPPEQLTRPGVQGCGWRYYRRNGSQSIIVSEAPFWDDDQDESDGVMYVHASIAGRDVMPSYHHLTMLHAAVFGNRYAYQVFAPKADHVNIHGLALHLWGRSDGQRAMPDFGRFGTI